MNITGPAKKVFPRLRDYPSDLEKTFLAGPVHKAKERSDFARLPLYLVDQHAGEDTDENTDDRNPEESPQA